MTTSVSCQRSDRQSLHDDGLRVALIRIAPCPRQNVGHPFDHEIERDASLFKKRRPWRAADLPGSNAARIRPLYWDSFRFDECLPEARAYEQPVQKAWIMHVVRHPVLHLWIARKHGFEDLGIGQGVRILLN